MGIIRDYKEIVTTICKEGVEAVEIKSEGYDGHVSAREFMEGTKRPEEFTPSTVIISGGYGMWELSIPKHVRKQLISAYLKIDTIRTHGMLHSAIKNTSASIIVNGQPVDKIYLVKPHPHGEDFGVDSRRPFQILRYIDRGRDTQTVRIEVDKNVCWDIDEVCIDPIILRYEVTPGAWMILGAIISTILGIIGSICLLK